MKHKKVLISVVFLFVILGFYYNFIKSHTLSELFPNIEKTISMSIVDGNHGISKKSSDKDTIHNFLNILDDLKYTKSMNQMKKGGYCYYVRLLDEKSNVITVTIGGATRIFMNHTWYHINKDITSSVEDYFNHLKKCTTTDLSQPLEAQNYQNKYT